MSFEKKIGSSSESSCGLVFHLSDLNISSEDDVVPVPLQKVEIEAKIVDFVSEIAVTQSYVNVESNPIEVVYMYPIEEEASVTAFKAEIDHRIIVTKIQEKEKARDEYHEAMRNQKTAALLEETQPDIFQIKLGQLKPGAGARITIKYLTELPAEDGKIKLTIPTTIAPRYIPPKDNSEAASKIASIPYSLSRPAPLSIVFNGISQCKVKSIKSPSHDFNIDIPENVNSEGQYKYNGNLSVKTTDLDRDIVLYIEGVDSDELNKPIVFLEKSSDDEPSHGMVGMVSLVPGFKLEDQKTELIFLVDRSGSMAGTSIKQAKKALDLFLHSLPADCFFNIWSFGSSFHPLFKEASAKYSDSSLKEALEHVRCMSADYGGTEIYHPLKSIFEQPEPAVGYIRQIFVLTDGDVSNAPSVISLVKEHSTQGRIFSFGLGSSASRNLVKGIARAGNGTAIFATEHEDLGSKVISQLKNAIQPALSNVQIFWGDTLPQKPLNKEEVKLETKKTLLGFMKPKKKMKDENSKIDDKNIHLTGQVPSKLPPIFDGTRLLAYHLYGKESLIPKVIKISADTPDGPLSVDINILTSNMLEAGNFVRQLAGRKKIQELEETKLAYDQYGHDLVKKAIIQIGLENSLVSKYTSFVGIDSKSGKKFEHRPMFTREIKNQIPSGYGGIQLDTAMPSSFGQISCSILDYSSYAEQGKIFKVLI